MLFIYKTIIGYSTSPCSGSGCYVVIDRRTKASANTQETSSDDGKLIKFLSTFALFLVVKKKRKKKVHIYDSLSPTHASMIFPYSGSSDTEEPSATDNVDSSNKGDLKTVNRLKTLWRCIIV